MPLSKILNGRKDAVTGIKSKRHARNRFEPMGVFEKRLILPLIIPQFMFLLRQLEKTAASRVYRLAASNLKLRNNVIKRKHFLGLALLAAITCNLLCTGDYRTSMFLKSANRSSMKMPQELKALALCSVFVAAFLLSSVYIITHAGHEHDRDGRNNSCATCFHLLSAEDTFRQPFLPAHVSIAIIFAVLAPVCLIAPVFFNVVFSTPVTLKTRLNN